jgi:hypothetical protein
MDLNMEQRPVGLDIKIPTSETVTEFVILAFKRMSDVTDQWSVSQRNFIRGAKISKRTGTARKPSLFQGPRVRYRVHYIKVSL